MSILHNGSCKEVYGGQKCRIVLQHELRTILYLQLHLFLLNVINK